MRTPSPAFALWPWLHSALTTASLTTAEHDETLVPVILGVMSNCPDAFVCESVFDTVLAEIGSKMTLDLTFVAKLDETDEIYGATCKHGPLECAGNIHELCAIKHTPRDQWWPLVRCLDSQDRSRIGKLEATKECAEASGIHWNESGLQKCIQGGEGLSLFHKSIKRTASLNITKSCTIVINGETRCIRDSTWYDCDEGHSADDFIRVIVREYAKLNGVGLQSEKASSAAQSAFDAAD